jgi:diacylglycerol O-acyltransferase 2, plant
MTKVQENSSAASFGTLLAGYLTFTATYAVAVGLSLWTLYILYLVCSGSYSPGLYVVIPYLSYTLTIGRHELKDGKRWDWFSKNFPAFTINRKFLGIEMVSSYPKELEKAEKAPNAQFMIAVFPHGTAADYRILMDGLMSEVFPNTYQKIRVLSASVLFRIPFVRELAMWTGCIDARRKVAERALERGRSVLVIPGGEAEQIRTTRGKDIIFLQSRKGFVKLALQKQVPIVPCYVFGASDYFYTSHALFSPREWLRKTFGICIPLSIGFWGSLVCPLPVKTTIVFGRPLVSEVKEKGAPTKEELDEAHRAFCDALVELFNRHKGSLGYGDRTLEII